MIVAFGDSLTAGVVAGTLSRISAGAAGSAWIQISRGQSGRQRRHDYRRLGAHRQRRLPSHPALVILEFGGNDGLRGVPGRSDTKKPGKMIQRLKQAKIPLSCSASRLPPNYGPDYVKPFTAMFPALGRKYKLRSFPFLLLDVYQTPGMMQPDGIHPSGEGNHIVAQDVLDLIKPVLKKR